MVRPPPEREINDPTIPLVDLTIEDTPIIDLAAEPNDPIINDDFEILNDILDFTPPHQLLIDDTLELEPLAPDIEYQLNISRIFLDLEQLAGSTFTNIQP